MDQFAAILVSVLLLLVIVFVVCYNTVDKWRFRADRQYPYVRELMEEWETVTRRLLDICGIAAPRETVTGKKHPWQAVSSANRLAEVCPSPDPENPVTAPLFGRQGELEEELYTYLQVYNGLAASHNKALSRPVVRWAAALLKWEKWEDLKF